MKYTIPLLLVGAAWIVLCLADLRRDQGAPGYRRRVPNYTWAEMNDIFAREQELDDEAKQIEFYHKKQRLILSRLNEERMSLRDAASVLERIARNHYPRLHESFGDRYPSLSSEEAMALLLLDYLEADGCSREVIERLVCEMTSWSNADPAQFRQPAQLRPE